MGQSICWDTQNFHAVVDLPENYEVLDLTTGESPTPSTLFSVGKYDEERRGLYETDLFSDGRFVHIGIDIGGPVGTTCHAFMDCEVAYFGYNPAAGDYGNVIVTKQVVDSVSIWALFGHLSSESIASLEIGQKIAKGEPIGWFGDKHENGGWEPHLHFQLSFEDPLTHDMPGVVSPAERAEKLTVYPDPRVVLGLIY